MDEYTQNLVDVYGGEQPYIKPIGAIDKINEVIRAGGIEPSYSPQELNEYKYKWIMLNHTIEDKLKKAKEDNKSDDYCKILDDILHTMSEIQKKRIL